MKLTILVKYALFLLCCFAIQSHLAQPYYFTHENDHIPLSATGINTMDVRSVDVDNDNDLDIITAGEFRRNLLLFNDGSGNFTEDPSRIFPEKNTGDPFPGEDSEDIAIADFDQDGDPDVLFVSEDSTFHELLINDGTGLFTFIAYDFPSSLGNAVAVLDLNNDDYPDLIIGNTGQNTVFINNQDLTFTQDASRWPVNTEGTQDFKLVDLDGDNDLDIIEGIDLGDNNILINNNGTFVDESSRLPDTGQTVETRKIAIGDANGDTFPDIFVATVNFIGTANPQDRLYLNNGNGFFTDATATNLPSSNLLSLDAFFVDYDDDNDLDIIHVSFQNPASNPRVLDNDGAGVYTETSLDVFEPFALTNGIAMEVADFNNDTFPDIYFGNFNETDDLTFFNPDILSVKENTLAITGTVYPNPSKDSIRISFPIKMKGELQFFDVNGRSLRLTPHKIEGTTAETTYTISLANITSGMYFYRLIEGNKQISSGSFIVDK